MDSTLLDDDLEWTQILSGVLASWEESMHQAEGIFAGVQDAALCWMRFMLSSILL